MSMYLPGLSALGWIPVDIGPSTLETISSLMPSYKVRNAIATNVLRFYVVHKNNIN
jgi:hypothetical protein